jgi:hypothetical protein
MIDQDERNLVFQLHFNGWVMMAALTITSLLVLPADVTTGVFAGGLLVAVNLTLLKRLVYKALAKGSRVTPKNALPKFYFCFAMTVIIIFILISQHMVNVLGLLLGLAVFLLDVFWVVIQLAGRIVYKTITKEAV